MVIDLSLQIKHLRRIVKEIRLNSPSVDVGTIEHHWASAELRLADELEWIVDALDRKQGEVNGK